jgi:hydrogenase maturation protease
MPDLREQLRKCFQGRAGLMGLGNVDYGDDGLGAYLAEALAMRLTAMGEHELVRRVIDAGAVPERFIGTVKAGGYDNLLFVDAVEFGGEPGSVLLLDADEMGARFPQISTHKISVHLLAKLIGEDGRTTVRLLGVQPGSLKPGQGLSPALQKTVDMLAGLLCPMLIAAQGADDRRLMRGEYLTARPAAEVKGL